jgi:hypothetical protein
MNRKFLAIDILAVVGVLGSLAVTVAVAVTTHTSFIDKLNRGR